MFNLPPLTAAILVGLPAMWVLYTLGFLWLSRGWAADDAEREQ